MTTPVAIYHEMTRSVVNTHSHRSSEAMTWDHITIFPQHHEALPFLSELKSVISLISNLLSCFAMTCDSFMYLKIFTGH